MGLGESSAPKKLDGVRIAEVQISLDAYLKLPWWWVYILSLLRLCKNREELAVVSFDGQPPPRSYWLHDDEIAAWKKDQEAMKEDEKLYKNLGNPMRD